VAAWDNSRADKWPRDLWLPTAERDWKALRDQLDKRPGPLDHDGALAAANVAMARLSGGVSSASVVRDILFHVVVPDPSKIQDGQVSALARIRWRGVRASVWQVAAERSGSGEGRFAIRECWVPPVDVGRETWTERESIKPLLNARGRKFKVGPVRLPVTELLARMAKLAPELHRELPAWKTKRGDTVQIFDQWSGPCPALQIAIGRDEASEVEFARFTVWIINPQSLLKWHGEQGARAIEQARHAAIADWLLRMVPDAAHASDIRQLRKVAKDGTLRDDKTGLDLRYWHSGGLSSASVECRITGQHELIASLGNRALEATRAAGKAYESGFGPTRVEL
jgi:hypothetical protein